MARPKAFAEPDALHAAMEVFWQKGYHHASMQDLVDGMGINRASLYDTFGDKHALYLRTLECYSGLSHNSLNEALQLGKTTRQKLEQVFALVITEIVNDPDQKGCFITNATLEMLPNDAAVGALVTHYFQHIEAMFTEVLGTGRSAGELRADLPVPAIARFLLSQLSGLRVLGKTQPSREVLTEVVEIAMKVINVITGQAISD